MKTALVILSLLASSAFAQVGICKTGVDCTNLRSVSLLPRAGTDRPQLLLKDNSANGSSGIYIERITSVARGIVWGTGFPASGQASILYGGSSYLEVGGTHISGLYASTLYAGARLRSDGDVYVNSTTFPNVLATRGYYDQGEVLASFPACNGTNKGGWHFATDTGLFYRCNGSAWVASIDSYSMSQTSVCFDTTCANSTDFTGGGVSMGTLQRVECSWATAPVGDGSQNIVVQLGDRSGAFSEVCSCTLGTCDPADNGTSGGSSKRSRVCTCGGTLAAGTLFSLRLKSTTNCTTNPGQITCNVIGNPP